MMVACLSLNFDTHTAFRQQEQIPAFVSLPKNNCTFETISIGVPDRLAYVAACRRKSTTQRYLGKISDAEAMGWIDNLHG